MQVLDQGTWPNVIDLPTGTGKTAVLGHSGVRHGGAT